MQHKDYQPEPSEITICNKCGNTCMKGNKDIGGDIENPYGLIDVVYCGGYFSPQEMGDEMLYHFSICEECLAEFMGTFKIPAKVGYLWDKEKGIEPKYFPKKIKNKEKAHELLRELMKKDGKSN